MSNVNVEDWVVDFPIETLPPYGMIDVLILSAALGKEPEVLKLGSLLFKAVETSTIAFDRPPLEKLIRLNVVDSVSENVKVTLSNVMFGTLNFGKARDPDQSVLVSFAMGVVVRTVVEND